jgi:hypothetical protein
VVKNYGVEVLLLVVLKCIPCYVGPSHHGIVCVWVVDSGDGLQRWRVAANILNKQLQTA